MPAVVAAQAHAHAIGRGALAQGGAQGGAARCSAAGVMHPHSAAWPGSTGASPSFRPAHPPHAERLERRQAVLGSLDGASCSLAVATPAGRVLIHTPSQQAASSGQLSQLSTNRHITALAAGCMPPAGGSASASASPHLLFLGGPCSLQAYDVVKNRVRAWWPEMRGSARDRFDSRCPPAAPHSHAHIPGTGQARAGSAPPQPPAPPPRPRPPPLGTCRMCSSRTCPMAPTAWRWGSWAGWVRRPSSWAATAASRHWTARGASCSGPPCRMPCNPWPWWTWMVMASWSWW
jgi:hypothetical protein